VGNINDSAYLPVSTKPVAAQPAPKEAAPATKPVAAASIDKKYDWYQNHQFIFLSYKVSTLEVSESAEVTFTESSVTIAHESIEGGSFSLQLTNQIVPEGSSKAATSKKIEIKLKKAVENVNWMGVEKGGEAKLLATSAPTESLSNPPAYPTSSKSKKNWDAINKDIKKAEETEKPEGDAALNSLFKQIYERADENTRRAMIKSYQTSGGTVLSTNWEEVADKDYEGKDRPEAPEGQQWAK
jgi:suppressor of G2 allele of SKP1